jgi:hypothetical protein
MQTHGFDMYRVFLSTPGDLQHDREACQEAISEVNAREAMPLKILLVSIGLVQDDHIVSFRSAVSDNIRQCSYYIQLFEDDWGPKNLFRKAFYLALDCRDDASFPMREVIVGLKAAPRETDPEILAFRKELEDRTDIRLFHYTSLDSLKAQLLEICTGWVRSIAGSASAAKAGT